MITLTAGQRLRFKGKVRTGTYTAYYCHAVFAWGSEPGEATVKFLSDSSVPPLEPYQDLRIDLGPHTFYGLVKRRSFTDTESGREHDITFVDYRELLKNDLVFGSFNNPHHLNVAGRRVKEWWHILPDDFSTGTKTWTPAPLSAAQILDYAFNATTVQTGWTVAYHQHQARPVFGVDCMGGKELGALCVECSEPFGLVFAQMSQAGFPFLLEFVRKGQNADGTPYPPPPFPPDCSRSLGDSDNGAPTLVRVLGERNLYQVMNVPMTPDWAPAWAPFADGSTFIASVYAIGTDPTSGAKFNAIPGDTDRLIGWQLAHSYANEITVAQYATLRNDTAFADTRLFQGRSRMDMPAMLYLQQVVYRAFRPDIDSFTNANGETVWLDSAELVGRLLCRCSHYDVTNTPQITADPTQPSDGTGYAVAQGYMVDAALFGDVNPEQFNVNTWTSKQQLWTKVGFQIDDSGEGQKFILFDEPVIVAPDLLVTIDGQTVVNAGFSLSVPAVKAALTFAAERYAYDDGVESRERVISAGGLGREMVQNSTVTPGPANNYGWDEIPFADGQTADAKAAPLAEAALSKGTSYAEGGFNTPHLLGYYLTPGIDRIEVHCGADGTYEKVDFSNERRRDVFIPERDLDRRTLENTLFQGQKELRDEARAMRHVAAALQRDPSFRKLLMDLLAGKLHLGGQQTTVWLADGVVNIKLAAGTPIWGEPGQQRPLLPANAPAAATVFRGAVVREQEPTATPLRVQTAGVALLRVKGPVSANDPVGKSTTAGATYLEKNETAPVGRVLADVPAGLPIHVELVKVALGGGGGGGTLERYVIEALGPNAMTCYPADANGAADRTKPAVTIAKPKPLRNSSWSDLTLDGWRYNAVSPHTNQREAARTTAAGFSANAIFTEITDPVYKIGDNDIYAMDAETGVEWPSGTAVTKLDVNASARHWRPLRMEAKVCVIEGNQRVPKKVTMFGGPLYPDTDPL